MKKNIIIGSIALAGLAAAVIAGLKLYQVYSAISGEPRACTMEAKLCPDGSTVGRGGPNCEFAFCPGGATGGKFSEAEARVIAEKTCIKGGEALTAGYYNENSKTWWFDANLNATQAGCNPACVVSEETKLAEINWRCTGALPIANFEDCAAAGYPVMESYPRQCRANGKNFAEEINREISCTKEQRRAEVCTKIYQPVCAIVEIQCIKAPCNPVKQTFGNACEACLNGLVKSYVLGECPN